MTENYYHQGWIYGPPTCVILHATRSGRSDFDHLQELTATVGWFQNPSSQASAQWVISPTDAVRVVPDDYPSWASGYHNFQGYNIEVTQPTGLTPFEDGHYKKLVAVCAPYVEQGIPIVRLGYLSYTGNATGFVGHQDTQQGISVGKSDPGRLFDWARFFAELEGEMGMTEHELGRLKRAEDEINRLKQRSLPTLYSQVSWLRAEVGVPPQFDNAQAHESALLRRIEEVAAGGGLTIEQVANGLKVTTR